MKKTALTLLTCLCFSSLNAYESVDLRNFVLEQINMSGDRNFLIEETFPEDYITSKEWHYHQGKIDALNNVLFYIDFGNGPCTSD